MGHALPRSNALKQSRSALWRSSLLFLLVFVGLQLGWDACRGSRLDRWVVDDAAVRTGVAAISMLTPRIGVVAHGPIIESPTADLHIQNGCDGTEVYFLLIAALLAYRFPWRLRFVGLLAWTAWIFAMNELRLLALFYALHGNRVAFQQIHGLLGPLALILGTAGFFLLLLHIEQRSRAAHA